MRRGPGSTALYSIPATFHFPPSSSYGSHLHHSFSNLCSPQISIPAFDFSLAAAYIVGELGWCLNLASVSAMESDNKDFDTDLQLRESFAESENRTSG